MRPTVTNAVLVPRPDREEAVYGSPGVGTVDPSRSAEAGERRGSRLWSVVLGKAGLMWCVVAVMMLGLIGVSLYLAAMRILQVDECINVWIGYTGVGGMDLYQRLLSIVLPQTEKSIDLFIQGRFMMVEVFWLNILLLALATGEKLGSRGGILALLGAATLAPLWDYGFELRHDNLILTGLLLTWYCLRVRANGVQSYFIAGVAAVVMQLLAYKAMAYTIPLTLLLLAFPKPGLNSSRLRLALAWLLGAGIAFGLAVLTYARAGWLDEYLTAFGGVSGVATGTIRFLPWKTLGRLLTQTPLLLSVVATGVVVLFIEFRREGRNAIRWEGVLPEAILLAIAGGVLFVNPTPYAYNLINFTPFLFLFGFRFVSGYLGQVENQTALAPMRIFIIPGLICTHFVPFAVATARHFDRPNSRQEGLMSLAERLSDPLKDPVYDAIGMIPTRPIVDRRSFLHGTWMHRFSDGSGPTIREMLAANPPVVLIKSYRTGWLSQEDQDYIASTYVALSDDFHVLGRILPSGGGEVEVVHPGRYRIASLAASDLAGTYPSGWDAMFLSEDGAEFGCVVDGQPLETAIVELGVGTHEITCDPAIQPTVVWVGPELDRVLRLEQRSHQDLFVNWY